MLFSPGTNPSPSSSQAASVLRGDCMYVQSVLFSRSVLRILSSVSAIFDIHSHHIVSNLCVLLRDDAVLKRWTSIL